jgi:hypothetical protein
MLAILGVAAIVLVVLYVKKPGLVGGGGDGRPARADENDLTHVKCNSNNGSHPSKIVEIPVNGSDVIKFTRKMVFVCKDEQVHWTIADPVVQTFTVTFKNGVWPFPGNPTPLQPGSSGSATPGSTTPQTVKQANRKYDVYEYDVSMTRIDGTHQDADPHIIPMGP